MSATLCYADLAGYTALVEENGAEAAAELAVRFTELVAEALGPGDTLSKTVGDAAVVACANAEAGVLFASALWEAAAGEPDFPGVRAAIHDATAFGDERDAGAPALDVAARLIGWARRGEALATRAVAEAAARLNVEACELGKFRVIGIAEPITVFQLDVRADEGEHVEDPVCRLEVERERAPARLRHKCADYYFCSLACAGDFARNPDRYARR